MDIYLWIKLTFTLLVLLLSVAYLIYSYTHRVEIQEWRKKYLAKLDKRASKVKMKEEAKEEAKVIMLKKIKLDSQEFREKYTSKTDSEHGVIFVPNIPGLPVLDSNGEEIADYTESVPDNSFDSLMSLVGITTVVYIFYNNGPYSNSLINYFWRLLKDLWYWWSGLFN
jgi:hypothetical protein